MTEGRREPMWKPTTDIGPDDAAVVGEKAAGLGWLASAGFPVPPAAVITVPGTRAPARARASAVAEAIQAVGPGPYAVRSSGVAEDRSDASFAGQYDTILNVSAAEVVGAVERCVESATSGRLAAYTVSLGAAATAGLDGFAVIIQRMLAPKVAGVAFTADPVNGDRSTCVVTAVRGLGERLVSGQALGDEWAVQAGKVVARRRPERAIDRDQVLQVADAARRIASIRGSPRGIEWAIDADGLWILQDRPMTALPPDVAWVAPSRGAFSRAFRFGEWISEPVTPLFESWLLTRMEDRLHEIHHQWVGQVAPRPRHVLVNGWYFYSLNFMPVPGGSLGRSLPGILNRLARSPRRVAVMIPQTARLGVSLYEREWREELLPRYRGAISDGAARVETEAPERLPALIDELSSLAGEYFASLTVVAGSAYKVEMQLAGFYRRHLAPRIGGSHLALVSGLAAPLAESHGYAVETLDWWRPMPAIEEETGTAPIERIGRLIRGREAAEQMATDALAASPRRLRTFRSLLADAQHLAQVREEQVREFTRPWPTMRRAVLRIGAALVERGTLDDTNDVFFLTRQELEAALSAGNGRELSGVVKERQVARALSLRLVPPLTVGRFPLALRRLFESAPGMLGAGRSEQAIVTGVPASPGRASGPVRVIRSADDFGRLQAGDVLVAPATAPAWTQLFGRASAVVTDVGSALSHASIIAREYGIPAVVGCGDATVRLHDGQRVTVDGAAGLVEVARGT